MTLKKTLSIPNSNTIVSLGVIYIATGQKYIKEACTSAASFKKNMPNISITGFFDKSVKSVYFDNIVLINKSDGKKNKVFYMSKSPYYYSLFMDTDTYVCDNVSDLFSLLDKVDIAVAHAPYRETVRVDGVPDSFPEFNTGVILFKKSLQITSFLENWIAIYEQNLKREIKWLNPNSQKEELMNRDQPSFREALYNSDLRVATLTPEYNCRFEMPGYVDRTVKILHGRHSNLQTVAEAINAEITQRIYRLNGSSMNVVSNKEKLSKWSTIFYLLKKCLKKFKIE